MSAELRKAQARYNAMKDEARRRASLRLRDEFGLNIRMTGWSRKAETAFRLWEGRQVPWDWSEIFRRHREPKCFDIAIWSMDDRLVGLALATMTRAAVTLAFVEGDPKSDCEFRGKRVLIALEACANYAQAAGVNELRGRPMNEALASLYQDTYGFTLVSARGEGPYYAKRI
jgi:hypothetical protein